MIWLAWSALAAPVRFVAIGDVPYRPEDVPRLDSLLARFGDQELAFAVHVGDLKPGSAPCDDATLRARRDQLAQSPIPMIYTPGDNEWTDCHRAAIDGRPVDPLERLSHLRSLFYATPLGAGRLDLAVPVPGYPENQRWTVGGLVFATFHVVGSADGRGRTPAGDAEAAARRVADKVWLGATVAQAKAEASPALVLFQQADTAFTPDAFADWNQAIASAAADFGGPTLLVHGDSHKPAFDAGFLDTPNLWRVIVPGDDRLAGSVITFEPERVAPFTVVELAIARDRR